MCFSFADILSWAGISHERLGFRRPPSPFLRKVAILSIVNIVVVLTAEVAPNKRRSRFKCDECKNIAKEQSNVKLCYLVVH